MWGCIRNLNSYTAGNYVDRYFTSLDNVDKFILPLNKTTETFGYNNSLGDSQRIIISAKVPHPNVWAVSKIENTKPLGLLKITVKQVPFNDDTDYIEYDDNGNIIGMWADYYSADQSAPIDSKPEPTPTSDISCNLSVSSPTIKIGGSYRTVTASYMDTEGNDVSDEWSNYNHEWRFFIGDSTGERIDDLITVKEGDNPNVIKIKFPAEREYIGKQLFIDLYTRVYVYGAVDSAITIIG